MRIQIDRQKRNSQEDNLFLELIKSLPDNEDTEPETGKNGKIGV